MQINDFKSIVTTFSDPGIELIFEKNRFVIQVNGDLIDATIFQREGDIYVDEGSGQIAASSWILSRLARLSTLASRLLSSITEMEHFVTPAAHFLPTLERGPQDNIVSTDNAVKTMLATLDERSPLETKVLYVTSDAGEGKTFLINQLAREQAKRFSEKKSDWLLVPIPLGGRHFLRFDDITIGALQNRYRFPFLYYSSFLALVKMGVIVPAFDGFEEMFIEGSSGEALSAMGILVGSLESQGAMVVAARKAYFEFENLRTQERLFDTIRTYSVGFGKLELQRWAKSQFIAYCQKRDFSDAEALYQRVSERLLPDHALLTRAVLVKRLVDVATKSPTLDALLEQLQKSKNDFFSVFVRSLIEREASEKWTDRSGEREVGSSLLTVEEHCELLSQIAISMWENKVDHLKRDSLEFVADYFCETNRKSAFQAQQIRERIRGHAMLVTSENATNAVEFDHDEFRLFFLGEGIAKQLRPLNDRARAEVFAIFRRSVLPKQAQHALIQAIDRDLKSDLLKVIQFLLNVSEMDVQASYTRENCSDIIIRMLSDVPAQGINIKNLVFSPDSLRDRKISNVNFFDCYFSATSLELTKMDQCSFDSCSFSQLRIFNNTELRRITFDNCKVDALVLVDKDKEIWNPAGIEHQLKQIGVSFINETPTSEFAIQENESDAELSALEKIIRYFMRSTHISESVMRIKLGPQGQSFIDNTLPLLLKHGVMKEIENRGSTQRRFRLNIPLHDLNDAITTSNGSFNHFLDNIDDTVR